MPLLALVQPGLAALAQAGRLKPVQHEQGALDAPQLLQREIKLVLALVAAKRFSMAGGSTVPACREATRRRISPSARG